MLVLEIPQPLEAYIYYDICSATAWKNQRRLDYLKLEKKLGTHSWYQRVNLSIFGVSVVGIYNVATQYLAYEETSHALFWA